MEQVYTDSARSPLQEYIIKLNQHCLVQMDDSKYKVGRDLWRPLYKVAYTMGTHDYSESSKLTFWPVIHLDKSLQRHSMGS